jgi:hypothetical protein
MSIVADIASIGSALIAVGFAIWITIQLFKKTA